MSNTIKIYYSESPGTILPSTNTSITTLLADLQSRLGYVLDDDFVFEFNIFLESELTEGDLVYIFKPFRNMVQEDGQIVDFSTKELTFSLNAPVNIEIQASYDGTVNLILSDNLNSPRLINSRFSVSEGKRYYVVDRFGSNDTNLYNYNKIDRQTRLYKTINKIPKLDFVGLKQDGKLAVGNYVFYFRLVDADDNETDIITESGIVSCHVGGINDPLSIRGGIGNENSGKSIVFKFTDLDSNYSYLNLYYSRSTSDYSKQEITTYYKISTKYAVSSTSFEVRITGYEPVESITRDKINLQYNIIDRNKTAAQTQNRLFLANIHRTTLPYEELRDLSCRVLARPIQVKDLNIGFLNTDYTSRAFGECAYYNSNHIYNYTGYWDEEIYRLAIVYIMKDFSLSDPYNVRGGDFTRMSTNQTYASSIENPLFNEKGDRKYVVSDDNGFLPIRNNNDFLENINGVIKIKSEAQINSGTIKPIGINIEIPAEVQTELFKYTRGFFVVRQKRIPTILSQGFSIGHDSISGLPLIPEYTSNEQAHVIQGSTIYQQGYSGVTTTTYDSVTKSLALATNAYRLPAKGEVYFTFISDKNIVDGATLAERVNKGGALLVPDLMLNSEYLGQVLSGSEFTMTSTKFAPITPGFTRYTKSLYNTQKTLDQIDQVATNFVIDDYKPNLISRTDTVNLLYVQEDTTLVSFSDNYYSSRAGIPEEAWRFSAFLKEEYGLVDGSDYTYNGVIYKKSQNALIRGDFMSYVGVVNKKSASKLESGIFYNIRTLGYSNDNIKDLFITRSKDNAPFMAISDRFSWDNFNISALTNTTNSINVFRGDCFINQATIRVMRNFQDAELPTNDVIVNYSTLSNFPGYKKTPDTTNGVLELPNVDTAHETAGTGVYAIVRADVNAARLGYWVTLKFCSNINFAFRCTNPSYLSEYAIFGKPRGFYPLSDRSLAGNSKIPESNVMNVGYNSTTSDKEHFIVSDVQAIKNDFTNRIMFSEIHATDAFKNGYRIFEGLNYRDYTIEFGTITRIIAWGSNLVVVFENGVGMVAINERTMAGVAEGENIFTRGAGVLAEKPFMLSQGIGSSWFDSIHASQNYIYGVDTTAKKIWRTDGVKFEVFSDFKVQKFLNDNLTLTVYDRIPSVGLRNVVTHFNVHKYDIMFTFYDQTFNESEKVWNLCYNEQLNNWVTRYSWSPAFSENVDNTLFSFSRGTCKVTSMISKSINSGDGIGSIYIDTPIEVPMVTDDYLSLLYEKKIEDSLSAYTSKSYNLAQSDTIDIINGYPIEFLDSATVGSHPMAVAGNYPQGYDKTCVIIPEAGHLLLVYNMFNARYLLSSNSKLYFYMSDNTDPNLAGDTLIATKINDDFINNSVQTTEDKPNLKIRFIVGGTANEAEAASLVRDGWSFNIVAISFNTVLLDTTEYLLTLQGIEKYKNPTLEFSMVLTDNVIYDNNIFKIDTSSSILSIKADAFAQNSIDVKYTNFLAVLKRIYFGLLVNLKVYLQKNQRANSTLSAYDQFRDVLYVRPNLATIRELKTLFSNENTIPQLRPGTDFTAEQVKEVIEVLTETENKYIANTTTDLWKHGNTDIFGTDTISAPAVWYGETHPFEFEFVVCGDELGIHKLFDNLKIISNKVEPKSLEYEIIGDAYEFTRENLVQNPKDSSESYLKSGYSLVSPAVEITNNKTKERGIRIVQEVKNVKNVGLRKGNVHYKEDMWEVMIAPLRVTHNSKVIETKIRDKYCRIRVKYVGNQLAIITALQTIYTLSNS